MKMKTMAVCLLCALSTNQSIQANEVLALIPMPAKMTTCIGEFTFPENLKAYVDHYRGDSIQLVFNQFQEDLNHATGIKTKSV